MNRTETNQANGSRPHDPADLEIFDSDGEERLDYEQRERILRLLLSIHPEAPVGAHSAEGVMVPMPDSVALARNPVQEARSGLDLIVFDERVIAGWERLLRRGISRYPVTAAGYEEVHGTVFAVDVREVHGVIVTIAVMDLDGAAVTAAELTEAPPELRPRFATLWKDQHGMIVKADEATGKMLGFAAEELVGRRSLEFIHPDDHALAVDNWIQMLAVPGPARRVRVRHSRGDGSWMWVELTNHNLFQDPDYRCAVSDMLDISEEMEAHELVDRLARAVPVGLLQVDRDGQIAYSNDRLHEILGVERTDHAEELLAGVAPDDRVALQEAFAAAVESGRDADVEIELVLDGGEEVRRCSVGLRPLAEEGGEVGGVIACLTDITESARMRDELQRRATYDELTGCFNRAAVMRLLEEHVASGRRASERAVMFVDVDGFKAVNDRYGHAAGDELLRVLARALNESLRGEDIVGRMGGDEFLIVCPDIGGPDNAEAMVRRLLERVPAALAGHDGSVQLSIGFAWSRGEELDAEGLVARADHAMYAAKRAKRGSAADPAGAAGVARGA